MLQKAVFSKNFRILVEQLRTAPEEFNDPVPLVLQETNVPQFTPRIQFLLDRVPEGARVLDLGSCKGEVAFFLKSKKRASVVCIEREPEYVTLCREKGLKVIDADLNHLDGPALRWALSQRWDVAIIIDSLNYWSYPALILSALSDRVGKVLVTIANGGHIRSGWKSWPGRCHYGPTPGPGPRKTTSWNSISPGVIRYGRFRASVDGRKLSVITPSSWAAAPAARFTKNPGFSPHYWPGVLFWSLPPKRCSPFNCILYYEKINFMDSPKQRMTLVTGSPGC